MSLLEKRANVEYEKFTIKIQKETSEMVRHYARFVNRQQSDVIDGLLRFVFSKDVEFRAWLKSQPMEVPQSEQRKKKERAVNAAG